MTRLQQISIVFLLLLICAQGAFGASITITPSGNGAFIIQGNSLDGIAGIDLEVSYDNSSLASPKVDQGSLVSGAMFAANPNFGPSVIKIAIVRSSAFSGSGTLALVTFASHTGSGIVTVSNSMINAQGKAVPGSGKVSATDYQTSTTGSTGLSSSPGIPFSQTSPTTTTTTTTVTTGSAPTTSSPATSFGTITMPSDVPTKSDTSTTDTTGVPVQPAEPAAAIPIEPSVETKTADPPAEKTPAIAKTTTYKGTLENFRAYKGEKSPDILVALFNKKIATTIHQEPTVALSEGKTPVKIVAELKDAGEKSPNFALNGAKLVSLSKGDAPFTWLIEVLPQTGVLQASLTILTERDIIEYPLTLAPPVEGLSPAETDFIIFLNDSGVTPPKRDLNGDNKHDYLDDYIYTAHYLIKKNDGKKPKK